MSRGMAAGLVAVAVPSQTGHAQEITGTPVAGHGEPVGEPGGGRRDTPAHADEEVLRLVRPGFLVDNFNPAAFAQDFQIPSSYLEPLVRPDPATLAPTSWLAERWTWYDDGLRLVLQIRDDVVWHNGEPFTASDAAFSYEVYRLDRDSVVSGLFSLVDSIQAPTDNELEVRFTLVDGNWLFNVASLPVFSRSQYESFWSSAPPSERTLSGFDWAASLPVGTGPWNIRTWENQVVEFDRFEQYWGDSAQFETLEVSVIVGSAARDEAWRSGHSSLLWPVSAVQAPAPTKVEGAAVSAPAPSVMFAAFNFANPVLANGSYWTDPQVRRAVSQAVDRQRYAEEVFNGSITWDAAGVISQPWAYDPTLRSPSHNREAAMVALAEAGWFDYDGDGILEDAAGTQFRPTAILREDAGVELHAVMARVARDLAEVGISLTTESLSVDEFESRWIGSRDYDLIAYAYDQLPGFTDYDLIGSAWDIRTNPAGWNPGGYSNPEADAAIEEFLTAVTVERQRSALARLQRAINDDLFGLWLGFPHDLILVASDIDGFVPDMAWQTAQTWKLRPVSRS